MVSTPDTHENTPSREEIAAHEAGHAAIMLLFGYPFAAVSIEETDWYAGIVLPDETAAYQYRTTQSLFLCVLMDIVGLCAGEVAEARQRGESKVEMKFPRSTVSIESIEERRDDASHLHRVAASVGLPTATVGQRGLEVASAFLRRPTIWLAVERIREVVLARTVLPYAEARAIFDTTISTDDRAWAVQRIGYAAQHLANAVFEQWRTLDQVPFGGIEGPR